jgi:hypothetical protein
MTKVGGYAIDTSTTLESNKSQRRYVPAFAAFLPLGALPTVPPVRGHTPAKLYFYDPEIPRP